MIMNKFDKVYNRIISEWKLFNKNKDKTKLKYRWDESDELLSKEELIEKYVDHSDTDWKWDHILTDDENIIILYEKLINDPPNSDRVSFISSLLSDEGHQNLQEIYNSKREEELIVKHLKSFY